GDLVTGVQTCALPIFTGIPLLKFSSHTGARAVRAILQEQDFQSGKLSDPQVLDLAIIGGGVSGISAGIEAKQAGLNFRVFEATQIGRASCRERVDGLA